MSDDYALRIAQKYRLAISLALLNTKPQNLSIDEYMDQIKHTINDQDDDLNVSVCSDDFRVDNDLENLDNRVSNNNNGDNGNDLDGNNGKVNDASQKSINILGNFLENIDNTDLDGNNSKVNDASQKSSNGLSNFEENIGKTKDRQTKFREMVDLLKGVEVIEEEEKMDVDKNCGNLDQLDIDLTQFEDHTFFESVERYIDQRVSHDNACNDDKSQQNRGNNDFDFCNGSLDIASQRDCSKYDDRAVSKQNIGKRNIAAENIAVIHNIAKTPLKRHIDVNSEMLSSKQKNPTVKTNTKTIKDATSLKDITASNYSFNIARHKAQNKEPLKSNTQNTENTQFNTHYSESQNVMTINRKFIYGTGNQKTNTIENNKGLVTQESLDVAQGTSNVIEDIFEYTQDTQNMDGSFNENACNSKSLETENPNVSKNPNGWTYTQDAPNIDAYSNENSKSLETNNINMSKNERFFLQDAQYMDDYEMTNLNERIDSTIGSINEKGNRNQHIQDLNESNIEKTVNNIKNNNDPNVMKNKSDNDIENIKHIKDNQITNIDIETEHDKYFSEFKSETVPFKIMKEMNKVKVYLNHQNKVSDNLDAGFKSKSQLKSSLKGATQFSNVSLDQNATSLLNYIITCPLVTTTQDFNNQISEVLGQLIDRLHEDEIYPTFLEQQLKIINKMLQQIYEEENYGEDMFQKKDEHIQRILLLNKSKHIQKFTIEKINDVLNKFTDDILKNDALHEIQNINQMENLSYVFHVLYLTLQMYCSSQSSSQVSTQSTQSSQDIRKSGITDIWRKKWIPNFKELSNEGSSENRCVVRECCAILNKIIVDFMEGYSLIAYSALKCFNLMQSL